MIEGIISMQVASALERGEVKKKRMFKLKLIIVWGLDWTQAATKWRSGLACLELGKILITLRGNDEGDATVL